VLVQWGVRTFQSVWSSPTLMTWGSFLSRSLSLVIVLPLILRRLDTPDIALWYLFSAIIGLQMMVDLGFSPTFSRVIAFAMGGLSAEELRDLRGIREVRELSRPNWLTIEHICSTMWIIYSRITLISSILLCTLGTWALIRPISLSSDPKSSWLAWFIILGTSTFTLLGNVYSSYLQGVNQIAILRRWEIITSLGSIITSFLVLTLNLGILGLVASNQAWAVINILRNRWLANYIEGGRFKHFVSTKNDDVVIKAVWPSAWRSGVGIFMTYGLIQLSSILYAQFGSSDSLASYLLGLKLIQMITQFSQAPFYSKLPLMAQKRALGGLKELVVIAQRGMKLSYWVYILGFIGFGIFGQPLLILIGSNASFPEKELWCLLGLAMFAERYGAMHIQLYSTTNHIVWHIVTLISGFIYITSTFVLFRYIDFYAFPLSLLISYLSFYCWYCARKSYKSFNLRFWEFERSVMIPPFLLLLTYSFMSYLAF